MRNKLGKETKIGLAVIGVLLVVFAVVLVRRMNGPGELPDVAMNTAADAGNKATKTAAEKRQPTVVEDGSHSGRATDRQPPRSLDQYSPITDNHDTALAAPLHTQSAASSDAKASNASNNSTNTNRVDVVPSDSNAGGQPTDPTPSGAAVQTEPHVARRTANDAFAGDDAYEPAAADKAVAEHGDSAVDAPPPAVPRELPRRNGSDTDAIGRREPARPDESAVTASPVRQSPTDRPSADDGNYSDYRPGTRSSASVLGHEDVRSRQSSDRSDDAYAAERSNTGRNDVKRGYDDRGDADQIKIADEASRSNGLRLAQREVDGRDNAFNGARARGADDRLDRPAHETSAVRELPAQRPKSGKYVIGPNDSLYRISQRVYGTGGFFKALLEYNRDRFPRPDRLKVGDEILVPTAAELRRRFPDLCPKARVAASQRPAGATLTSQHDLGASRVYVVEEGDTLFDIAKHELGNASRWAEIVELNRETLTDDLNFVRPGTKLLLPAPSRQPVDRVTREPNDSRPR